MTCKCRLLHTYLPGCETRRTQQMATRFYPDVLVILGADLTQLEGGAHLTVQLVLLLSHLDVLVVRVLYQETQVRVHVPPIGVQVARKDTSKFQTC